MKSDMLSQLLDDEDDLVSLDELYDGDDNEYESTDNTQETESEESELEDTSLAALMVATENAQNSNDNPDEYYDGEDEEDELAGVDLDSILSLAIEQGASDVHISSGLPVSFTILGDIVKQPQLGIIPDMVLSRIYAKIVSHVNQSIFAENFDLDTSYTLRTGPYKGRRTRLSVGRSLSEIFMVFRIISHNIPSPKDLGVDPRLQDWVRLGKGLVLVCGETGSGKALHKNTIVPTALGYKKVGQIDKTKDLLIDYKGRPVKIKDIHKVNQTEPTYYLLFSNGEKVKSSDGHLWKVRIWDTDDNGIPLYYKEQICTSQELYELTKDNYEHLESRIKKISIKKISNPIDYKLSKIQSPQVSATVYGLLLGTTVLNTNIIKHKNINKLKSLQAKVCHVVDTEIAEGDLVVDLASCSMLVKQVEQYPGILAEYLYGDIKTRSALVSMLMWFFAETLPDGSYLFALPATYDRLAQDIYILLSNLSYSVSERLLIKTDYKYKEKSKYVVFRCGQDTDVKLHEDDLIKIVNKSAKIAGSFVQLGVIYHKDFISLSSYGRCSSRASNMLPIYKDDVFLTHIEPVADNIEDYMCFEVDSDEHLYLFGQSAIPTHNSTTFASLINEMITTEPVKIITIEKPIEYVYDDTYAKAFITQREVGADTRTFAAGLKAALRQAPDVIMVGEVRDKEEFDELLSAAESGHLSLSTLHATAPDVVIDRISGMYSGDERARVLSTLKSTLAGVVNQVLVKSPDGTKRYAVQCILEINDEVAEMVGRADSTGILNYMRANGSTMEHELIKAIKAGKCDVATARKKAVHVTYFDELCRQQNLTS